jgi:hypothetical protein
MNKYLKKFIDGKLLLTIFVSLMWCNISIAETKYYPNGDEYIGEFKKWKT